MRQSTLESLRLFCPHLVRQDGVILKIVSGAIQLPADHPSLRSMRVRPDRHAPTSPRTPVLTSSGFGESKLRDVEWRTNIQRALWKS